MKVLIAGGTGNVGSALTANLTSEKDVSRVIVIGRSQEKRKAMAKLLDHPKVSFFPMDVRQKRDLLHRLSGVDILVNAISHEQNLYLMEAALEGKTHYIDLGGMFHITRKQLQLHGDFSGAGLTAVLCMGACPGLSNVFAYHAAKKMDEVREIHIYVGSRRGAEFEGFNMSPRTLLDEFTKSPVVYENGEYRELAPLAGLHRRHLPEPIGEVEGFFAIHSEVLTLPDSIPGVRNVTYWVAFPPAIMTMMKTLISLGLLSQEPVRIKGVDITPREFLYEALGLIRTVSEPLEESKALQVEINGLKKGNPKGVRYDLTVASKRDIHQNASAYWTAIPAAVGVMMIGRGQIEKKGVFPPERAVSSEDFLNEVRARGLIFAETCSEGQKPGMSLVPKNG